MQLSSRNIIKIIVNPLSFINLVNYKNLFIKTSLLVGSIIILSANFSYLIAAQIDVLPPQKLGLEIAKNAERIELHGQTRLKVSLADLLYIYLVLSRSTKQAVTSTQAAYEFSEATKGKFQTRFSAGINKSRGQLNVLSNVSANSTEISDTSFGLKQLTPIGLSFFVKHSIKEVEQRKVTINPLATGADRYIVDDPNSNYITSTSLGLNFPLLNGFGVNDTNPTKQATANYIKAKLGSVQAITGLANRVITIYWSMVANFRYIEALESQLALSKRLLREAEIRFDLGGRTNTNVLEFRANVLSDETKLKQALDVLYELDDFIKLVATRADIPYSLYPSDDNMVIPFEYGSTDDLFKEAKDYSLSLKSLLVDRTKARLDEEASTYKMLPKLDFNLALTQYGYGKTADSINTIKVDNEDLRSYQMGLNFEIPIGSGGNYALHRAHALMLDVVDTKIMSKEESIQITVNGWIRDLDRYLSQIKAQEVTLTLRKRLLDQTLTSFQSGSATAQEVSGAQLRHSFSQQALDRAKANYLIKYYQVEIDRGKFLEIFPRLAEYQHLFE
ncbi:MAG: TolC family protein [SAR324 cluster bacterium]|nr:TolC family protein [SAR324 cluster bacterium]